MCYCTVFALFLLACVAWQFWLLSNKGGRGQKNREEIGAGATESFLYLRLSAISKYKPPGALIGHLQVPKLNPHFQNEAKCTTFLVKMSFICRGMKNHFHIKG